MPDAAQWEELHRKLDAIQATANRNGERISSMEIVLAQCVQGVNGLVVPIAALSEAVRQLVAGVKGEKGADLALTLKGILEEMGKQTGHLAVISLGLERVPAIMEDTAINAALLVRGDGAGARPEVPVPDVEHPTRG